MDNTGKHLEDGEIDESSVVTSTTAITTESLPRLAEWDDVAKANYETLLEDRERGKLVEIIQILNPNYTGPQNDNDDEELDYDTQPTKENDPEAIKLKEEATHTLNIAILLVQFTDGSQTLFDKLVTYVKAKKEESINFIKKTGEISIAQFQSFIQTIKPGFSPVANRINLNQTVDNSMQIFKKEFDRIRTESGTKLSILTAKQRSELATSHTITVFFSKKRKAVESLDIFTEYDYSMELLMEKYDSYNNDKKLQILFLYDNLLGLHGLLDQYLESTEVFNKDDYYIIGKYISDLTVEINKLNPPESAEKIDGGSRKTQKKRRFSKKNKGSKGGKGNKSKSLKANRKTKRSKK